MLFMAGALLAASVELLPLPFMVVIMKNHRTPRVAMRATMMTE